jgi:hypothetical protein
MVFACVDLFSICKVIALDLISEIYNFQLVLHEAQKVFDPESCNFTGMLLSV